MQYLEAISKMTEWSLLFPRQTIQYHRNPSQWVDQLCWRSWSWMVLWRPRRPSRTNTQKRCPIHCRGLECKGRKSRDTWSNRKIWPWSTEWTGAKADRVLWREDAGHSKHPLPTAQEKTPHMDIARWPRPNQIDYILCSQKWSQQNKTESWLWLRSWTPYCQIQT